MKRLDTIYQPHKIEIYDTKPFLFTNLYLPDFSYPKKLRTPFILSSPYKLDLRQ